MRKFIGITMAAVVFCGCHVPPSQPTGGSTVGTTPGPRDGSSIESAIPVNSVEEEYRWLELRYPGYQLGGQALTEAGGRQFDVIEFRTAGGKKETVYFDISSFYGR